MKYLGIDFGLKNIGLSFAEGPLAEPFVQKKYKNFNKLLTYLVKICQKEKIDIIIIGLPEGNLKNNVKKLGSNLKSFTNLPIFYQDETLTTKEAQQKMIQANISQKKRRQDHRAAATLILQDYLDTHIKD